MNIPGKSSDLDALTDAADEQQIDDSDDLQDADDTLRSINQHYELRAQGEF